VQRPTMSFVVIKTPEQMDLLALHRVRSRLVGRRTGSRGVFPRDDGGKKARSPGRARRKP
jgi:hypothetical protein